MKKALTLIFVAFLLVSCFNDSDDELIAQCSMPTNVEFDNITNESVLITWEASNGSVGYTLEYGASGFNIGEGTIVNTALPSTTLTGLDASATYDVYVQSVCLDNVSMQTSVSSFTTLDAFVIPEFLPNLSDMNLFSGDLTDLTPSVYAFEYELNTPLFTDFAHKQRFIVLPQGTSMEHVDDGLPIFPDNTVIAKTFYYFNDERNESLGKKIVETRVLIKQSGSWELGNYKWNNLQTEATLDATSSTVPVTFINNEGVTNNIDYVIPSNGQCFTCHSNSGSAVPIGPKLRSINMNGQLQALIDQNLLSILPDPSTISVLPNWEDDVTYSLEERARAYFDVNCAHCHSPGGNCDPTSNLDFRFETRFSDTNITLHSASILARTGTIPLIPGYSMPLIGTTIMHPEGFELISDYIDSL